MVRLSEPLDVWYDPPLPKTPALCSWISPTAMCFDMQVNGLQVKAMLNTGASLIFMDHHFAQAALLHIRPVNKQVQVANWDAVQAGGTVSAEVDF